MGNKNKYTILHKYEQEYQLVQDSGGTTILRRKNNQQLYKLVVATVRANEDQWPSFMQMLQKMTAIKCTHALRLEAWVENTGPSTPGRKQLLLLHEYGGVGLDQYLGHLKLFKKQLNEDQAYCILEGVLKGLQYFALVGNPIPTFSLDYVIVDGDKGMIKDPMLSEVEHKLSYNWDPNSIKSQQALNVLYQVGLGFLDVILSSKMSVQSITSRLSYVQHEKLRQMLSILLDEDPHKRKSVYRVFTQEKSLQSSARNSPKLNEQVSAPCTTKAAGSRLGSRIKERAAKIPPKPRNHVQNFRGNRSYEPSPTSTPRSKTAENYKMRAQSFDLEPQSEQKTMPRISTFFSHRHSEAKTSQLPLSPQTSKTPEPRLPQTEPRPSREPNTAGQTDRKPSTAHSSQTWPETTIEHYDQTGQGGNEGKPMTKEELIEYENCLLNFIRKQFSGCEPSEASMHQHHTFNTQAVNEQGDAWINEQIKQQQPVRQSLSAKIKNQCIKPISIMPGKQNPPTETAADPKQPTLVPPAKPTHPHIHTKTPIELLHQLTISQQQISTKEPEPALSYYCIEYGEDGSRYEGYRNHAGRTGHGVCYYPDGLIYEGQWRNGLNQGQGVLYELVQQEEVTLYGHNLEELRDKCRVVYAGSWQQGKMCPQNNPQQSQQDRQIDQNRYTTSIVDHLESRSPLQSPTKRHFLQSVPFYSSYECIQSPAPMNNSIQPKIDASYFYEGSCADTVEIISQMPDFSNKGSNVDQRALQQPSNKDSHMEEKALEQPANLRAHSTKQEDKNSEIVKLPNGSIFKGRVRQVQGEFVMQGRIYKLNGQVIEGEWNMAGNLSCSV